MIKRTPVPLPLGTMTFAISLVAALGLTLLSGVGCREKDVPFAVDSDEIERYLNESEEAVDLFRSRGLVMSGTYSLVPGGKLYTDTILATKRMYDIWISDTAWHMGSYGSFKVADALVTDEYTVRTTTKVNDKDSTITQTRRVERLGVFWKLGDDGDPYLGWILQGINGGSSPGAAVSYSTISGDYRLDQLYKPGDTSHLGDGYIRLRDGMPSTIPGGNLGVTVSISPKSYPVLSTVSNAGYYLTPIPEGDSGRFVTTVQLPTVYRPLYDVALIQFIGDSVGTIKANPLIVPYKVLH